MSGEERKRTKEEKGRFKDIGEESGAEEEDKRTVDERERAEKRREQ